MDDGRYITLQPWWFARSIAIHSLIAASFAVAYEWVFAYQVRTFNFSCLFASSALRLKQISAFSQVKYFLEHFQNSLKQNTRTQTNKKNLNDDEVKKIFKCTHVLVKCISLFKCATNCLYRLTYCIMYRQRHFV